MEQSKYAIDKGVPVARARKTKNYPFEEMDIGDSFLVPEEEGGYVRNAASKYGNYSGKKFTTRTRNEKDHAESGLRVWRIA